MHTVKTVVTHRYFSDLICEKCGDDFVHVFDAPDVESFKTQVEHFYKNEMHLAMNEYHVLTNLGSVPLNRLYDANYLMFFEDLGHNASEAKKRVEELFANPTPLIKNHITFKVSTDYKDVETKAFCDWLLTTVLNSGIDGIYDACRSGEVSDNILENYTDGYMNLMYLYPLIRENKVGELIEEVSDDPLLVELINAVLKVITTHYMLSTRLR